jgi:Ser/Thr protein kinase RdoA (MazF antagonist)
LRLTRAGQQTREMIQGEMEWLVFAAQRSAPVALPLRSKRGEWVETITDGSVSFSAVMFESVPGVHPEGERMTDEVLLTIGVTLGRLHRLGREFSPSHPALRRPHWHELEAFQIVRHLPSEQTEVLRQYRDLWRRVQSLPTDPLSYGLIHGDPEPWNMLLDNGAITFIDFEECCYCWRAFDVVVALMFAVYAVQPPDQDAFAENAWRCIYAGYTSEFPLSDCLLEQAQTLMRLRLFEDYAFHIRLWERGHREEWLEPLIRRQREMIESGSPVLNLDLREATE